MTRSGRRGYELVRFVNRKERSGDPLMIEISELQKGAVYEIRSRNLTVGVYDGNEGFIGIREKFGSEYLFTEYLSRESGGTKIGLDTVHPVGKIGLTYGNPLSEHYGIICKTCGKGAWKDEGGTWPTNEHCAGGCSDDDRCVMWTMNQLLFDVLAAMERPIREELAKEFPKITPPWRDREKEGTHGREAED